MTTPPKTSAQDPSVRPTHTRSSSLGDLNPLGLMEGVLGGQATDWEPPLAEELEPCFTGYTGFEFIDRGGMGAVYAATQVSLDRRVAFKILPPDLGQDDVFVESFHREARLLARLQHPHIVAVYDFGRNELGHLFIVMEYVEGMCLLDVMKKESVPVPRVLDIISEVCEALQFAHDNSVIHRDIKPTNILIDNRGHVRVADFGLARLGPAEAAAKSANEQSSIVMGTPVYASPEQSRPDSEPDHRSDLYSVGVTFYELITGHLPTGAFEPPSKKAGSPAILDKIVAKALGKRPEDRYQTAEELRVAVRKAADRITKPIVQHAISQRPIVSMMTTVIVTAGLIFLFGEIDQILRQSRASVVQAKSSPDRFIRLNDTFSLGRDRMTWGEAQKLVSAMPGVELASLHTEAEVKEVAQRIIKQGIRYPVWTGGWQPEAEGPFVWTDGSPFDFEYWMPQAPAPPVIITEIRVNSRANPQAPDGGEPDWIEVYNPGTESVDLTGWQLRQIVEGFISLRRIGRQTSSPSSNFIIGPREYRVVTCSDEPDISTLHLTFYIETEKNRLVWTDPRGNIIQIFDRAWRDFPENFSLVSDPEGASWGWTSHPTPGAANPPAERPLSVSSVPPPQQEAIMLLPDFDGRWSTFHPARSCYPLIRTKSDHD